jgi:hypothetical protein
MDRLMRLSAGGVSCVATLLDNATADAIWEALPLEARGNRWGDELYFGVPVVLEPDGGQEVVGVGDVAYWPPGHAVCIFWGPTPASQASEPRAASPVAVFARIGDRAEEFGAVGSGASVRLERASSL